MNTALVFFEVPENSTVTFNRTPREMQWLRVGLELTALQKRKMLSLSHV